MVLVRGLRNHNKKKASSLYNVINVFGIVCVLSLSWFLFIRENNSSNNEEAWMKYSSSLFSNRKNVVVFEAIPPTKQQVIIETKTAGRLYRNNVFSNLKMGLLVDWMTMASSSDWEFEVATHDGQQRLHGFYGMLPDGRPAWTPEIYVHYNSESPPEKALHHANFAFNKWRSDQLPLSLPRIDQRSPDCRALAKSGYYQSIPLPNTSVIIVAYNEALSTLFRSIHSVLDRTPPQLLHEIVVVDDGSDIDAFGEQLENYIALLPKTKLYRLAKRKGLMEARVYGAKMATGDTLTFLDSHIEALQGWLPPLLERVAQDRKIVTVPVIDSINPDTWEYNLGGISILGFSWTLGQVFLGRPEPVNKTAPMPSPIMAGGLFTIDRKWFFELGAYDPELLYYGGEEMEISFKIWQCGGRLECIPCSGVGHIFRSNKHWKGLVYEVPDGIIHRNKRRVAAVWMDPPHWDVFVQSVPRLPKNMTLGDLSQMKAIRTNLKCKSFQWYLDTVYPELYVPDLARSLWSGEIRHVSSGRCLDTMGALNVNEKLGMYQCHGEGGTQYFVGTKDFDVRVPLIGWDVCVDGSLEKQEVLLYKCHGQGGSQKWSWDPTTKQLQVLGQCLTFLQNGNDDKVRLEKCVEGNNNQIWTINEIHKKKGKKKNP